MNVSLSLISPSIPLTGVPNEQKASSGSSVCRNPSRRGKAVSETVPPGWDQSPIYFSILFSNNNLPKFIQTANQAGHERISNISSIWDLDANPSFTSLSFLETPPELIIVVFCGSNIHKYRNRIDPFLSEEGDPSGMWALEVEDENMSYLLFTHLTVFWSPGCERCWKDINIQNAYWRFGGDLWQSLSERAQVSDAGGIPKRKFRESLSSVVEQMTCMEKMLGLIPGNIFRCMA